MAYYQTIYGVMPYPLVSEENDIGGEYELTGKVNMRLMVADDHRGLGKIDVLSDFIFETSTRNTMP